MNDAENEVGRKSEAVVGTIESLRQIQRLRNHWARLGNPRSHHWYLTFEASPQVAALAQRCQASISFPYYDLTAADRLHMTLDRIAPAGIVSPDELHAIEVAAARACAKIANFRVSIGWLGGTAGAIGFNARPAEHLRQLRDTLREATSSVVSITSSASAAFQPHVSIAYCNTSDVPATQAVAAVNRLNSVSPVEVAVAEVRLVLLERLERSYIWQTVCQVPLSG